MTNPDEMLKACPLEFRPDDKGEFDEIVASFADGSVHVETLDDRACYIGFSWDDGRLCQFWVGCTGRGKLTYNHEVTKEEPPRFPSGYGSIQPADDAVVERVARAIGEAERSSCGGYPSTTDTDPKWNPWLTDKHRELARAALAALAPQGEKGEG